MDVHIRKAELTCKNGVQIIEGKLGSSKLHVVLTFSSVIEE